MTVILPNLFWVAKDERAPGEWEDAGAFDMRTERFAVADGASAAYRAREWAMRLVECYVTAPPPPDADEGTVLRWFARPASNWQDESNGSEPTRWYQQNAERRGSFAAFLGTCFSRSAAGLVWHAIAVGDCCLLHIRNNFLMTAFPISDPGDFGRSPDLVPSSEQTLERLRNKVKMRSGNAMPGDLFLMCSDALAKFLLREAPRGESAWTAINSLENNDDFAQLVHYLRSENAIEIDDVTLLRLAVVESTSGQLRASSSSERHRR
jgi:hypothetical protein